MVRLSHVFTQDGLNSRSFVRAVATILFCSFPLSISSCVILSVAAANSLSFIAAFFCAPASSLARSSNLARRRTFSVCASSTILFCCKILCSASLSFAILDSLTAITCSLVKLRASFILVGNFSYNSRELFPHLDL